eukprot:310274-Chlamydomonas_euryale.AAC.1
MSGTHFTFVGTFVEVDGPVDSIGIPVDGAYYIITRGYPLRALGPRCCAGSACCCATCGPACTRTGWSRRRACGLQGCAK